MKQTAKQLQNWVAAHIRVATARIAGPWISDEAGGLKDFHSVQELYRRRSPTSSMRRISERQRKWEPEWEVTNLHSARDTGFRALSRWPWTIRKSWVDMDAMTSMTMTEITEMRPLSSNPDKRKQEIVSELSCGRYLPV